MTCQPVAPDFVHSFAHKLLSAWGSVLSKTDLLSLFQDVHSARRNNMHAVRMNEPTQVMQEYPKYIRKISDLTRFLQWEWSSFPGKKINTQAFVQQMSGHGRQILSKENNCSKAQRYIGAHYLGDSTKTTSFLDQNIFSKQQLKPLKRVRHNIKRPIHIIKECTFPAGSELWES